MPHLRAAYDQFRSQGFEILSVSLDTPARMPLDKLKVWIEENGMTWRHVYDQQGFESPLATAFHVRGIPSLYLIGRDGQIAAMDEECRGEQLAVTVRRTLAQSGS